MRIRWNRKVSFLLGLILTVLSLPLMASAESLYIIPDSDQRELTKAELWDYQYDTLYYAFNEIYARHGYKFETGSRCYNWFIQMPWYVPNPEETDADHHATYEQCSAIENYNRDLIINVRAEMRALGTTNPNGKGMPTPPSENLNKPRGFGYISLLPDQKLAVYTAPSVDAFRANNGKALVDTSGAVYALGYDNGWMLMLYEANFAGQYRVGYISMDQIKGELPHLDTLTWEFASATVSYGVNMTDDPALTGNSLTFLPEGTNVIYLSTMFTDKAWDYIETSIDGKIARGFIPGGCITGI